MCLSPITIKNPSHCRTTYASEFGSVVELPSALTSSQEYITVPCGKCDDCRATYFSSLHQRAIVESWTSYVYFITLTYDNEHIPSITLPHGETIFYTKYEDVQNMFKRFRRHELLDRDFRYMSVNEYGDTYHRPHVHILMFVGKKDTDTSATPDFIREVIYNNLGKYFAQNVGTHKHPIYEPLFTFAERVVHGCLYTNYYVKYIPDQDAEISKSIRYIVGYLNKGSSFDDEVERILSTYDDDNIVAPLRYMLRSRCRFSKGLGCGFVRGFKHYIPRISVRTSLNSLLSCEISDNLPKTFAEFVESYPDRFHDLSAFILKCPYQYYKSLQDTSMHFTTDDWFNHVTVVKYFPNYLTNVYKRYFRDSRVLPKVSFYFDQRRYKYAQPFTRTYDVDDSPIYYRLRSFVDAGLNARVPYLSFVQDNTFVSLCKFYRERICTQDDYLRMMKSVGCDNFDEWQSLFVRDLNTRKTNIAHGNRHKYEKNADNICIFQKHCVVSHREVKGIELYKVLLSDCKR